MPSGFNCRLDRFAPGLLKCGVLATLNTSIRSCTFVCRPRLIWRNNPASHCVRPGPTRELKPAFPSRCSVTGEKANGSTKPEKLPAPKPKAKRRSPPRPKPKRGSVPKVPLAKV